MILKENLDKYAVFEKFSYERPDIKELCSWYLSTVSLLRKQYVLIPATLLEDYVNLLLKPVFYITYINR